MSSSFHFFGLTAAGPFVEVREPVCAVAEDMQMSGLSEQASASAYCPAIVLSESDPPGLFHSFFITDSAGNHSVPCGASETYTAEVHCTLNSTNWREFGVQKVALLATGAIYGSYGQHLGKGTDRWCYTDGNGFWADPDFF
ncbi:unnamed protein product [Effrenium voratum]|nr:unnamed protein product [Effrenium voratum]